MGRRALRKIDPDLDLSAHFFELEDVPKPFPVESFFGRPGPLEVEVGSGKGLFLSTTALRQPGRNFLGIEVVRKYARFSAAKLARESLPNARMICGDGLAFFAEHLESETIAAVHVYFPDPWWKKRHRKRRVMQSAFAKDIDRVLVSGGRLHFWSDVLEYFQETLELLRTETTLQGPHEVEQSQAEHPLDYRTHFERRMRIDGVPVYRSEFSKA